MVGADEVYKSIDADGHVVYSDRADASTAQSVVPVEAAPYPPRVLHFCWTNCFTLRFDNGAYRRTDGSDETWTVERFASTSVVLHRHDAPAAWNGFSPDVIYEGQVANEKLVDVNVNGRPVPDINMAWGAALETLPGSNADRDHEIEPAADGDMRTAEAPPILLNDVQPPCPDDGYLWTPGYWSWGGGGYYWVPGAWMQPPRFGVLWTPGYWGFAGAVYVFHRGYWGPHIGYYGGINYGYGYSGAGFVGGRWVGNSFAYNKAVNNINVSVIHNTYNETVINHVTVDRVSYNGPGGSTAAPTAQERAFAAEPHLPPTPMQRQRIEQAAGNPALMAQAVVHRPVMSNSPTVAAARPMPASPARVAAASSEATPSRGEQRNLQHAPPHSVEQPPQPAAGQAAAARVATARVAAAQPAAPKSNDAAARKPSPRPRQ